MSDVKPISLFLSYAHEDQSLVRQLEAHLSLLQRDGLINVWHNRNISAGSDWLSEIDAHLNSANIILICISASYLASDYTFGVEMQRALERQELGEALIIPVILRPVDWSGIHFDRFQGLPKDGKPITTWYNHDEAWVDVARGIRDALKSLRSSPLKVKNKTPEQVASLLPASAHAALIRGDTMTFKQELERYYGEHPEERLVIYGSETTYYENFVLATYAWQCWQVLTSFASSNTLSSFVPSEKKPLLHKIFPMNSFPPKKYTYLNILKEIVKLFTASLIITSDADISLTDSSSFFWTLLNVEGLFDNIHVPRQLPLLLYTGSRFDESHATELRHLMQKIAPKSRLALLLFFIEEKYMDAALSILRKTLQGVYAYDIIPLTSKDFLRVIDANNAKKVFRRHLLSKSDLNIVSPFTTTGPTPDSMFFGREHEIRAIIDHASTTSYSLIGGRRIGKTSILRRLVRFGLPEAGFRAFYQDCSYTRTQAELVQAITLDKSWFPTPPSSPFESFVSVIHALPDDKPLIILFDEADKLIAPDQPVGYPLLNTFRALANAGRCQFVFCGEHSLRTDMANPQSPLYNFANELLIGRLDFRAVQELILRPIKDLEIDLTDEKHIVERIWSFTSGHPNVIQRLCQRLINRINHTQRFYLGIEDVEAVIADSDFLRKDFLDTYWEQATALERLCSLIIARSNDTCTLLAVHNAIFQLQIHSTLNQVHDTLESLVDLRNILYRTADGYAFAVEAFPEVISKTSKLDDLLALMCEEYKHSDRSQIPSKWEVS